MRKEIVKRLKCSKCNKMVHASNKFKDDRFYCMNCGMNLGCYEARLTTISSFKNLKEKRE